MFHGSQLYQNCFALPLLKRCLLKKSTTLPTLRKEESFSEGSFRDVTKNKQEVKNVVYLVKTFRSRHAKKCIRAYADSEGQDQPAHPRSLIRAFAVRYSGVIGRTLLNVLMERKYPGEILRMREMNVVIVCMLRILGDTFSLG